MAKRKSFSALSPRGQKTFENKARSLGIPLTDAKRAYRDGSYNILARKAVNQVPKGFARNPGNYSPDLQSRYRDILIDAAQAKIAKVDNGEREFNQFNVAANLQDASPKDLARIARMTPEQIRAEAREASLKNQWRKKHGKPLIMSLFFYHS